ncbi:general substrate transporter [Mycena epipterygia]|nr:general substrate transporter [Mycena epipterygia]
MNNPNSVLTGAIVSTYVAGEAVGAIIQMLFGDVLGRKRFMQALCIVVTAGTVIQTAAQNYAMFLVGRILTGIAVGGLVSTVPIYNSEISPPASRGFIGGLSGYMIGIGGFLANWIGYGCGYISDSNNAQWRVPLALQIPPGVILFIGLCFFLPDSPRWLITKGRDEEALAAFTSVRRDLSGDALLEEFDSIKAQIHHEQATEVKSFREAWTKYKRRVIIAVAVQTMTSASGVNVINYYQTILYKQLGQTGKSILLLAAIYGTVGVIINFLSINLVDRFGRVKLLCGASAGLCLDLIYAAVMSQIYAHSDNKVGKGFAILGHQRRNLRYSTDLGINSTTWLYGVEILPIFLRSKVTGLASLSHFVVNIALTQAATTAFANIGTNYYYVFVGTTGLSAIAVYLFFPETKGKSLEAIAASFGDVLVIHETTASKGEQKLGDEERMEVRPSVSNTAR